MPKSKILIVDDEEWIRNQLKWALSEDYTILLAGDEASARKLTKENEPDIVMLDISLTPDSGTGDEGIKLLQYIIGNDSTIKVIMITGNDTRENALKCVSMGAYDFYSKPIDIEEIKISIKRALYIQSLERENRQLHENLRKTHEFKEIISGCKEMDRVLEIVRRVSTTEVTVLIQGESGTGKELIARAIHYNSNRKEKPFITINCGAIPEQLLESELFGHEKGAFTDAHIQRKGKLEMAQSGTVFLDEIAELSPALQVKILRFLQEKEIERVGGREPIKLDARVIAATNKNITDEIKSGKFREDLYYRLNVISINLPKLVDRENDVMLLANAFLMKFCQDMNISTIKFSESAIQAIKSYNWPGNVRELENKVKRALIMSDSSYIIPSNMDLPDPQSVVGNQEKSLRLNFGKAREKLEFEFIKEALDMNEWNVSRAADQIGIKRSTLYSLMEKYSLSSEKWRKI
jgi:two-component system, NtrC family, response regulator